MITFRGPFHNFRSFRAFSFTKPSFSRAATISGTPKVGSTLTCSSAAAGIPSPTLSYVWTRNGTPIAGATGPAYVVTSLDVGAVLAVVVTATNRYGSGQTTAPASTIVEGWENPTLKKSFAAGHPWEASDVAFNQDGSRLFMTTGSGNSGQSVTPILYEYYGSNWNTSKSYSLPLGNVYTPGITRLAVSASGNEVLAVSADSGIAALTRSSSNDDWQVYLFGPSWEAGISSAGDRMLSATHQNPMGQVTYSRRTGPTWAQRTDSKWYKGEGAAISGDGKWGMSFPYGPYSTVNFYNFDLNQGGQSNLPNGKQSSFHGVLNFDGSVAACLTRTPAGLAIWRRTGGIDGYVPQFIDLGAYTNDGAWGDIGITDDGKTIAITTRTNGTDQAINRLIIFETADFVSWTISSITQVPSGQVSGCAISRDGSTIAIGQGSSTVRIYKKR